MKKQLSFILLFTVSLLAFISTPLRAQDDPNTGIYVDGTFVDKIDCWTFDYMYMIFPISEKFKKYDWIILTMTIQYNNDTWQSTPLIYICQDELSQNAFIENFDYSKYGVWKWLRDKNLDNRPIKYDIIGGTLDFAGPGAGFKRSALAGQEEIKPGKYKGFKTSNYVIYFDVKGRSKGDSYEQRGNGPISYPNDVFLYRSSKIPVNNCKECPWDINAACPVTGKKVDLKVENSLAYKDHLGLIKEGPTSSSTTKTTEVKTTSPKAEVKTTAPAKTNTSSASSASSVKPLDKTKPNYFSEKNEDGKITREGYKKGEVMLGELRMYSDEGKLTHIYTYSNDEKNGPYAEYDPETGNILLSGQYKNGEKDGEWIRYNNGKKAGTDIYVNGEQQ